MELWLRVCLIAVSPLLVRGFLKVLSGKSKSWKRLRRPPGPWTLPIIGSLHHVMVLPHRRMMELSRRHGPLMHLMLGEVPTVVVSSAEAAELVMKTKDLTFASRPRSPMQDIIGCGGRGIVFAPYGDRWRQLRKICVVELLSSKLVKNIEGIRVEEVGNLLRSITQLGGAGATVNMSAKMAELSSNIVSRAVFGGKLPQHKEYLREVGKVNLLLSGFYLVDLFPSSLLVRWFSSGERNMRRSYGRIQRTAADIIDHRKGTRASSTDHDDDLLDLLLRLQKEDSLAFPLTTEIIGLVIFDLFAAATETTATTLAWIMTELLMNPDCMANAQREVREVLGQDRSVITSNDLSELHYMQMVIKEVFRLHPPVALIPRETREDCQIMGYDISKGTNIIVNVFAICRHPTCWDSPEKFEPKRFEDNNIDYYGADFEFTPFGAGRRQCPGILFGKATVETALANLLYHFDWVFPEGSSTESHDMSEKCGLTVSRKSDLHLTAIPHLHSNPISM